MAASQLWSEKVGIICFLMGLPFPFMGLALRFTDLDVEIWLPVHFFFVFLFVCVILIPKFLFTSLNATQDGYIQFACQELANATGTSVQYRRQFTGFCRPKGALPYRAIAIAPNNMFWGTMAMPNSLMIAQVPQVVDTAVQNQSPTVPLLQAAVPLGVSGRQTFQIQRPVVVTGRVVSVTPREE